MKKTEIKRIGIWGFGTVGKSALRFFSDQPCEVELFDRRQLEPSENALLEQYGATLAPPKALEQFLEHNDFILPSPGVDLRLYEQYKHKWIAELDILQKQFKKPIVAITGTAGKTTVTYLLSQLLASSGLRVWTGGNIGTGMLDLLRVKHEVDVAVLEVSSFQLEYCRAFAPTLAIWTNFYENHLDRHSTMKEYFAAKKKIFAQQTAGQHAIVPLAIKKRIGFLGKKNSFHFFTTKKYDSLSRLVRHANILYIKKRSVMRHAPGQVSPLPQNLQAMFQNLCAHTYQENALIVTLAAKLLARILARPLSFELNHPVLPPHRLEHVSTINGVSFYNDSKSTAPAPTLAAVQKLSNKPILLILGGLSKGVDRLPLIAAIKQRVKAVYAFGAEAKELEWASTQNSVPCHSFSTLEQAFAACTINARPGDQILLSPAGSSFDLFKNYKERGNHFKKLIEQISKRLTRSNQE